MSPTSCKKLKNTFTSAIDIIYIWKVIAMKLHFFNLTSKSDVDGKVTILSLSKERHFSVDLHSTKLVILTELMEDY